MARTLYTNFRWWETGEPQSMLVEEGRIVARGPDVTAEGAERVDLKGSPITPRFIDAHCHILPTGLDLQKLNLGAARSHAEVLDLVSAWHADNPDGWLHAVHYDQTRYDGVHITRAQLDSVSASRPILLRHVNGHAGVANSAALQEARVEAGAPDPGGGSYGRDDTGDLDGTLFEAAHEQVTNAMPRPSVAQMTEAILLAGEKMAALGIGCASDMMTGRYGLDGELQAYEAAIARGCPISIRLYVQWRNAFGGRAGAEVRDRLRAIRSDRLRVAGIKVFADGAIGSATAAIYGTYTGASPTGPVLSQRAGPASHPSVQVSGQLMYPPPRLNDMVRTASEDGWQVAVHAIGDYAADLVMDAFELSGAPARHRMEHGMILSDAQIQRMAALGCFLTFQPEFLIRFGHSYLRQLGADRAAMLKRARSVIDAGIPLSFSSDRPIVAGDPVDGIATATRRPDGFDPSENCTHREAMLAYTREAARVNGDADLMGSLEPGQLAEFRTA